MQSIFSDLQVVDLSTVLAGPSVGTFFAELGATVTKVENPRTHGDVTRSWKLASEQHDVNVSAYFSAVNFRKKYTWLDISQNEDRAKLDTLLRNCDVLITNFKSGDDIKFRLTDADVQSINPKVIHARLKGFESDETRAAYDVVLQAETGFMQMNGTTDSGPLKMPVAMIDVLAAHQLKEGILCALLQREKNGRGCVVECSLEKSALASLVNQATNYLMAQQMPSRMGSLHPNIAPYGEIFDTADEKAIVLAIGSDKQFAALCDLLGDPSISQNEKFSSNQSRVRNRILMSDVLRPLFTKKNRNEWMAMLKSQHIPAGAIRNMDEVMDGASAREMIREEIIDGVETKRMTSIAFSLKNA